MKNLNYYEQWRSFTLTGGHQQEKKLPFQPTQQFEIPYTLEIQPLAELKYVVRIYKGDELFNAGIYLFDQATVESVLCDVNCLWRHTPLYTLYLKAEDHKNKIPFLLIDHNPYQENRTEVIWKYRFSGKYEWHLFTENALNEFYLTEDKTTEKKNVGLDLARIFLTQEGIEDEWSINDLQAELFLTYFREKGTSMSMQQLINLINELNQSILKSNPTLKNSMFNLYWEYVVDEYCAFVKTSIWFKPQFLENVCKEKWNEDPAQFTPDPLFESLKSYSTKIVQVYPSNNGFSTDGALKPMGIFEVQLTSIYGKMTYEIKITHSINEEAKVICSGRYIWSKKVAYPNYPDVENNHSYYHQYIPYENDETDEAQSPILYLSLHAAGTVNPFSEIIIEQPSTKQALHLFPQNQYEMQHPLHFSINFIPVILEYFLKEIQNKHQKAIQVSLNDFYQAVKSNCPLFPYPEHHLKKNINQINQRAIAYGIIPSGSKIISYTQSEQPYDSLSSTSYTTLERLETCISYFGKWE